MKESIQLTIAEPCHENWRAMTPQQQGRFCGSCSKMVIDFSLMTDKEIIDYIATASQHVCGRFASDQLNKAMPVTPAKKRLSWPYLWNLLLATLLFTQANAQAKKTKPKKPPVIQQPPRIVMGTVAVIEPHEVIAVTATGTVYDAVSGKPVEAATVQETVTHTEAIADTLGRFTIPIDKTTTELVISSIGYEPKTFRVDKTNWKNIIIRLQPKADSLAAVEIVGYPVMGKIQQRYAVSLPVKDSAMYGTPDTLKAKLLNSLANCIPDRFKSIKVYPSPVTVGNAIQAALNLSQTGEYKVELLNTMGQVMEVQAVTVQSKGQVVTIPTQAGWSVGIYWIRISSPVVQRVYTASLMLQ